MLTSYRQEMIYYTSACDVHGHWKLSTVLDAMQGTANAHIDLCGCGHEKLKENHLLWVLFRIELRMKRYPKIAEAVSVTTFVGKPAFHFIPRYYVLRDSSGEEIATAGALWMLMDQTERRSVLASSKGIFLPVEAELKPPLQIIYTEKKIEGPEEILHYSPRYTELDMNGHLNNVRYADWLYDALGAKVLEEKIIQRISLAYNYEITPDRELEVHLMKTDLAFRCYGLNDGKTYFDMSGDFIERL